MYTRNYMFKEHLAIKNMEKKETAKTSRIKNRDKTLEYQRKWHKEHPNYQKELRQKNLERMRERDRKHYHNNIGIERERNRRYQEKNKDEINARRRQRYQENQERKEIILKRNRERSQKNKDEILKKNEEYREKNKERIYDWNNQFNKKWYRENKERIKEVKREYRENNPEIILKSQINYLNRLSIPFKLTAMQYKRALMAWAKVIKKRDKSCLVCGTNDGLDAHHIIHRSKYPELSFVENNGAMLCGIHHKEAHGMIC